MHFQCAGFNRGRFGLCLWKAPCYEQNRQHSFSVVAQLIILMTQHPSLVHSFTPGLPCVFHKCIPKFPPQSSHLVYLLQIHHFFLITSAYQFHHHHSLLPSPLYSFILTPKPFFSINPTLHRPLVPSGLISQTTWLFIGFPCSTVLLLFQFFWLSVF